MAERDVPGVDTYHSTIQAFLFLSAPMCILLVQKLTAIKEDTSCAEKTCSENSDENQKMIENGQSSFHTRRRIQHALTGLLFYICSFLLPSILCSTLLIIATSLFYLLIKQQSSSSKSNKYPQLRQWYITNFRPLLRSHELVEGAFPGAFWFLLGTTILSISFPTDIARVSLLCLSFGDPLAAWVGIYATSTTTTNQSSNMFTNIIQHKFTISHQSKVYTKSVAGCFACFLICFLLAMIQWNDIGSSILTGWTCMVLESTSSLLGLDDNVVIPIGTGLILWLYRGGI